MAKYTNHRQDFDRITLLNKVNLFLFYSLLIINIVPEIIKQKPDLLLQLQPFEKALNFVNVLFFMFSFLITVVTEFVLIPVAEKKRRLDYFENSFAKEFQLRNSEEYFTNDELSPGFYKMGVNLFQNLLFTTTVSKKMVPGVIAKGLIAFIIFLALSFIGLSSDRTFIPVLQAIFSLNVLGHTIKFLIYNQRLLNIFDDLKTLFSHEDLKQRIDSYMPQIIKIYVDYECNIAWGLISLKDSLFDKLNDSIEAEWKTIKTKFKIQ